MLANQTVAVTVNTPALLEALQHTFSSSISVLTELTQNARRAGATSVAIDISDDGKTVTVTDDGCGISDFGTLLSVASSGWSDETKRTEQPYGLGFLAALYAAETITVRSAGHRIEAATADLLALKPVEVVKDDHTNGTVFTLSGLTNPIKLSTYRLGRDEPLSETWSGFPIPVAINGADVPRPHALGDRFRRFASGWICIDIDNLAGPHSLGSFGSPIYLQGHKVATCEWRQGVLVHLDPTLYRGRAPDRTALDTKTCSVKKLDADIRKEIAAEVVNAVSSKGAVWAVNNVHLLKAVDRIDLLNDIDVLPAGVISHVNFTDRYMLHSQRNSTVNSKPVAREAVSALPIITEDLPYMWDGLGYGDDNPEGAAAEAATLNAISYVLAVKGAYLTEQLDPGHWIYRLPNYTPEVWTRLGQRESAAVEGQGAFLTTEHGDELAVDPVKSARLVGPCGEVEVDFALEPDATRLICGPSASETSMVCAFNTFTEDDCWMQSEETKAADALAAALAVATGASDGAAEVSEAVNWSTNLDGVRSALKGKTLRLVFDENGRATATVVNS